MSDPLDLFAQDEMERLLKTRVLPAVVREAELLATLDLVYRRTSEIASIAGELEGELQDSDFDLSKLGADNVSDAPVVRLLQTLFEDAVQMKASDIHIEPDEGVVRIRQRIDGVLNEQVMKEAAHRLGAGHAPEDHVRPGHLREAPAAGRPLQYPGEEPQPRCAGVDHAGAVRRVGGDASARSECRHFPAWTAGGMPADMLARFRRLLQRPYGMVLVTGPTGSGKTTTLYAGLSELNSPEKKIITVEDPVEYRLPRVNQVQVNAKIELTFARVLRAALRQDPDIVLIGEMRDQETAEIGLRAALTGHLVLSTLHTNDALTSAMRLIDMGAEPFLVATCA